MYYDNYCLSGFGEIIVEYVYMYKEWWWNISNLYESYFCRELFNLLMVYILYSLKFYIYCLCDE